jgi:hypothetical protein
MQYRLWRPNQPYALRRGPNPCRLNPHNLDALLRGIGRNVQGHGIPQPGTQRSNEQMHQDRQAGYNVISDAEINQVLSNAVYPSLGESLGGTNTNG